MGTTITGGSFTTISSGIFLFLAEISVFKKFALLIVSTICFSYIYSMVFFGVLMI